MGSSQVCFIKTETTITRASNPTNAGIILLFRERSGRQIIHHADKILMNTALIKSGYYYERVLVVLPIINPL